MGKWKIKKLIKNYIFMVIIFIITSLFLDLYLLNHFPNFVSNVELNEYPNIILINIDTLRPDHLSLYGYSLNTSPNLDKFAKDAVVFDNAIAASSGSLMSIASIFTGKYVSNHKASVINQELDSKQTTFQEILKNKGYNTAGFAPSPYIRTKYGYGKGYITYKDRLDFFEFAHTYEWFDLR